MAQSKGSRNVAVKQNSTAAPGDVDKFKVFPVDGMRVNNMGLNGNIESLKDDKKGSKKKIKPSKNYREDL